MSGLAGNIAAIYKYGDVTVEIGDAAFADKSEYELERVRNNARSTARRIAVRVLIKETRVGPAEAETQTTT